MNKSPWPRFLLPTLAMFAQATTAATGQSNATSRLLTWGETIGRQLTIRMDGLTSNSNVYVLGSLTPAAPTGSYFLRDTFSTQNNRDALAIAGGTEGNAAHEMDGIEDWFGTTLSSTEYFNPITNSFSAGPELPSPMSGAGVVTLADGRTLIAGGIGWFIIIPPIRIPILSSRTSLYDPIVGDFTATGFLREGRVFSDMALLKSENALIAGGLGGDIFNLVPIAGAEIFDAQTLTFSNIDPLPLAVAFPRFATLPDKSAGVLGGIQGSLGTPSPVHSVHLWDEVHAVRTRLASLRVAETYSP